MFPRSPASNIRAQSILPPIRLSFHRSVSLGLFREKKPPSTDSDGVSAVPSIQYTSVSTPLKFSSAVSARPKRETRRLPIFPDGQQWTGIRGGTAGDDAWVVGKYYLGILLLL